MADGTQQAIDPLRAYLDYFRDLGVHDFYRNGEAGGIEWPPLEPVPSDPEPLRQPIVEPIAAPIAAPAVAMRHEPGMEMPSAPLAAARLVSLTDLYPASETRIASEDRATALQAIRDEIGDCTRCPLAYAGRRTIVFGDGDPNARLMFVGEGPGADEDTQGLPFVGKSGQLLNNMIAAMGLSRDRVYIANVVKCRPPANRAPEPVEAGTCTPFLARQMDVVHPEVVVALGATAAMYLLGVKQSLASLRGRWHEVRGAKAVVTYHPAFLLRDPRQKAEAWKDLQMVMAELGLKRA
jgi:DNA polymerase